MSNNERPVNVYRPLFYVAITLMLKHKKWQSWACFMENLAAKMEEWDSKAQA
jgi:hypothetical protein